MTVFQISRECSFDSIFFFKESVSFAILLSSAANCVVFVLISFSNLSFTLRNKHKQNGVHLEIVHALVHLLFILGLTITASMRHYRLLGVIYGNLDRFLAESHTEEHGNQDSSQEFYAISGVRARAYYNKTSFRSNFKKSVTILLFKE